MNSGLLPCPFCGGKARNRVISNINFVDCPDCYIGFSNHEKWGNSSVEEWNKRCPVKENEVEK